MPCCASSSPRRRVDRQALMSWGGFGIRLAAAGVWLVAGASKLPELETFRTQVERYDALPDALVAPFAYALPLVELGLGVYLAVGLFVRGAALVGTLLMLVFLTAQAQAWARGLVLDCGCFGGVAHEHVGLGTMLRDLALGLPTFVMLVRPARRLSLDRRLFGWPDRFAAST
jgi:uncharacterized membrane protein YphA (DoxX/SURF4 family)